MFAARNRVNQFSVLIKDFDFQITKNMAALLVVIDERIGWPAWSGEARITLRPASIGVEILNGRRTFDESSVFRHQVRSKSTKRRNIVDDPDAASVGCQH